MNLDLNKVSGELQLVGEGRTNFAFRIGELLIKCPKNTLTDKNVYNREKNNLVFLKEHGVNTPFIYGVFNGDSLQYPQFQEKNVLIEQFIDGETLFEVQLEKENNFPSLISLIERINDIKTEGYGDYNSGLFPSWKFYLMSLEKDIRRFINANEPSLLPLFNIEYTDVVDVESRCLLMEFNPHNVIVSKTDNKLYLFDVAELLFGDPLFQYTRYKLHFLARGYPASIFDNKCVFDNPVLEKNYFLLVLGKEMMTRHKLGFSYENEKQLFLKCVEKVV